MYLVGQNNLKSLIDEGKLDNANFIIIKGPRGYGKTYLTKYIANHYNMTYMLLDNKVDTIRTLVESANKNNNNCLYHFKDFDKSAPAAKAALLKIAEETPRGVKIVVTTSAYNLLDTLISRAYVLNIEAYQPNEIEEYSNNLSFDSSLLAKMSEMRITMTPSLLFNYKNRENVEEIFNIVEDTIKSINNGLRLEDASRIANNFWKEDKEKVLIYLNILTSSHFSINKDYYLVSMAVERALYRINKITINNYRQLIHDMLMEMV